MTTTTRLAAVPVPVAYALALLLLAVACATAGHGPRTVSLRVSSNVPDATVWIDDQLVARVSDFSKGDRRLGLGFHRLEVRAPGYYSHFEELDVKADRPIVLQAPLHQLLD